MKTLLDLKTVIVETPTENFIVDSSGNVYRDHPPETHVGCIMGQLLIRKWQYSEIDSLAIPNSGSVARKLAQINNGGISEDFTGYQTRKPSTKTTGAAIKRRLLVFVNRLLKSK